MLVDALVKCSHVSLGHARAQRLMLALNIQKCSIFSKGLRAWRSSSFSVQRQQSGQCFSFPWNQGCVLFTKHVVRSIDICTIIYMQKFPSHTLVSLVPKNHFP
jgi:hypothetical protein